MPGNKYLSALLFICVAVLTGCADCSSHLQNQTIGSAAGAVIGGGLGSAIGTGSGQLLAITGGAVAGAVIGGIAGSAIDHAQQEKCPQDVIDLSCYHLHRLVTTETMCPGVATMSGQHST